MNAARKWDSIRSKVTEVNCDIVCFQKTKKDNFDLSFLRKVLPANFDTFVFVPSVGASGGLMVAWKSDLFDGSQKFSNGFALAVQFTSKHNCTKWNLMNIYGPCTNEGKTEFTDWLKAADTRRGLDYFGRLQLVQIS